MNQGEIRKLQQNDDATVALLSALAAQIDRLDDRVQNLERRGTRLTHVCYRPPEAEPPTLCAK